MGYGEKMLSPIKVGNIKNPDVYFKALSGSQLECLVLDGATNLVARGTGFSFNQSPQQTPVPEWGQRKVLEIVTGMMMPGQAQIQSMFFMHLNDSLPTVADLPNTTDLTILVRIAQHENVNLMGIVLYALTGARIAGESQNWNAQSLALINAQVIFREKLTGLQWLSQNSDLANAAADHAAYPAEIDNSFNAGAPVV